jgi:hypothetical protein
LEWAGWKEKLLEDAGDYVVVVGISDFGAVEGAWDQGFVRAEVVDEDFAVDLGVDVEIQFVALQTHHGAD